MLLWLLARITWIPGLILFRNSSRHGRLGLDQGRIFGSHGPSLQDYLFGPVVLSLIALAISAWVR